MARTSKSKIVQAMEDGTLWVTNEIPTGSVNGSNTSFTLADAPNPASDLEVWINGQKLELTTDYSLSGDDLTMVRAYAAAEVDSFYANYRVEPQ